MPAAGSHQRLHRSLLGGYRVADVEVALASLELMLAQVQLELEATRKRLATAEARVAVEVDATDRVLLLERELAETRRRLAQSEADAARHREAAEEVRALRDRLAGAIRELAVDLDADRPTVAPPAADPLLFGPEVELEAGVFADLASLNAFEQALAALPCVAEVYIRGLDGGRTTIHLTLREPSPLLQAMTERLPYVLDVDSHDAAHISMTVQPAAFAA